MKRDFNRLVPGAGLEPAREFTPLVFETNASTDSAIRASLFDRKDNTFFSTLNFFLFFFQLFH